MGRDRAIGSLDETSDVAIAIHGRELISISRIVHGNQPSHAQRFIVAVGRDNQEALRCVGSCNERKRPARHFDARPG